MQTQWRQVENVDWVMCLNTNKQREEDRGMGGRNTHVWRGCVETSN